MATETKLGKLLDAARQRKMSPEETESQRVSFAYGNAPDGDSGTIETIVAASTIMKQTKASK